MQTSPHKRFRARQSNNIDSSIYGSSYPPSNHHSIPIPQNRLPQRTTKTTTKLVLFPLDPSEEFGQQQQQFQQTQYQDVGQTKEKEPESPEELPAVSAQSHAERLHKSARQSVPRGISMRSVIYESYLL